MNQGISSTFSKRLTAGEIKFLENMSEVFFSVYLDASFSKSNKKGMNIVLKMFRHNGWIFVNKWYQCHTKLMIKGLGESMGYTFVTSQSISQVFIILPSCTPTLIFSEEKV